MPGDIYKKYGTTFGTRLLVIDKTGATTKEPLSGEVESLEQLLDQLAEVRNARTRPGEPSTR